MLFLSVVRGKKITVISGIFRLKMTRTVYQRSNQVSFFRLATAFNKTIHQFTNRIKCFIVSLNLEGTSTAKARDLMQLMIRVIIKLQVAKC